MTSALHNDITGTEYLAMLGISTLWHNMENNIQPLYVVSLCRCAFYIKCLPSPVRQQEGADVRDGWGSGPKLGQRHDVLEGDVCLRTNVHDTHILWRAAVVVCDSPRGSGWGSPENLDNDGVSPDGLHHRLVMVDLGKVTSVHLVKWKAKSHWTERFWALLGNSSTNDENIAFFLFAVVSYGGRT